MFGRQQGSSPTTGSSRPPIPPPYRTDSSSSNLPLRRISIESQPAPAYTFESPLPPLPSIPTSPLYEQSGPSTPPFRLPPPRRAASSSMGSQQSQEVDWEPPKLEHRSASSAGGSSFRRTSTPNVDRASWVNTPDRNRPQVVLTNGVPAQRAFGQSEHPSRSSSIPNLPPPPPPPTRAAPPLPQRPPPPTPPTPQQLGLSPVSPPTPSPSLPPLTSPAPSPSRTRKGKEVEDATLFETQAKAIIEEELQRLLKAHEGELFLLRNSLTDSHESITVPRAATPPTPKGQIFEEPSVFANAYPPLPPSPTASPTPVAPSPTLQPTSAFPAQIQHVSSLLTWRLKRFMEERIESGEAAWRDEKRRAKEEWDAMEKEKDTELERADELEERVQALESENTRLRSEIRLGKSKQDQDFLTLRKELHESTLAHSEDLESASRQAMLLQERIDILQAALNDPDGASTSAARGSQPKEDESSGWMELVNLQGEELSMHNTVLTSLASHLTCSVCSELMKGATTLSCGHSGCQKCLQSWFDRSGGVRSCPECRELTTGSLAPAWALREMLVGLQKMGLEEEG